MDLDLTDKQMAFLFMLHVAQENNSSMAAHLSSSEFDTLFTKVYNKDYSAFEADMFALRDKNCIRLVGKPKQGLIPSQDGTLSNTIGKQYSHMNIIIESSAMEYNMMNKKKVIAAYRRFVP